ncbi:MAG: YbaB/EbfC family nucleoid-associated protein [bacterium]|nr:YbaB/EbfC family nucleoid-associated protein [bacterium]
MFNKLKQFKDLRNQAKTLQAALAQESVQYEKSGINIAMNGNLEITSLTISPDITREKLPGAVTETVNETIKRAQKVMAKKVQEMGGLSGFN